METILSDNKTNGDTTLLITVEYNKDKYTISMYKKANVERKLQHIIGLPYTMSLIKYLQNNNTPIFPMTISFIKYM